MAEGNDHTVRRSDRPTGCPHHIGLRLKDNWYIFVFLVPIIWGIVIDHFALEVQADEINNLKEITREQIREQSRNQREINQKLTIQAETNGKIQATQESILRALQEINRTLE